MQLIAEVKTHSPFGWESDKSWEELFEIAEHIGHVISVHTDPRWHGSMDLIARARSKTDKKILAKGIHESDEDISLALEAGADYVLVVGRVPEVHIEQCVIEPESLRQLSNLSPDLRALWNSRDLRTGGLKSETFDKARKIFPGWLCQASNIVTYRDIHPEADAILVGSHLPAFCESFDISNL